MLRYTSSRCDPASFAYALNNTGFLYLGQGEFAASQQSLPPIPDALLRVIVSVTSSVLTYTCVPPGNGERIGVDRDLDGFLDGDEVAAGSDPADPDSTP
ncbi:thrombospondin type 3 repeat-containing protein [Sorangium sp. So ce513]|uniref:thrombospondin type 3 repeat-containing protein n=1 Tax=Sorangium sp. So ce513 TaxID=3133315 RepID=UPI003F5F7A5E